MNSPRPYGAGASLWRAIPGFHPPLHAADFTLGYFRFLPPGGELCSKTGLGSSRREEIRVGLRGVTVFQLGPMLFAA